MECIRELLDRTERAVRTETAAIPNGTYFGDAATDDDGTVLGAPVWVRVGITVKGDNMTLEFPAATPSARALSIGLARFGRGRDDAAGRSRAGRLP